jgi:hydrogenase-1 operon protein HyaE
MTAPAATIAPSPLIQRLTREFAYPVVDLEGVDEFAAAHEWVALFLPGDPDRFPEANDVAVVLPELVQAFGGRFAAAVAHPGAQAALKTLYGIRAWPALVFLRRGRFLGTIERMQDWDVYLRRIARLLEAEPTDPPGAARA